MTCDVTRNEKYLISGSQPTTFRGVLKLWNLQNGSCLHTFPSEMIHQLYFSLDGHFLYTFHGRNMKSCLSIRKVCDGRQVKKISLNRVLAVSFTGLFAIQNRVGTILTVIF